MSDRYATAASLTAAKPARTEDVELSDGRLVQVRGLSRRELLELGDGASGTAEHEVRNLATCILKPKMTEAQVRTWQSKNDPETMRDIAKITEKIRDMSGYGKDATKSAVPADEDGA